MSRQLSVMLIAGVVLCAGVVGSAEERRARDEIIDPAVAAQDLDFVIQGEYLGEGILPDGKQGQLGAQVVARGEGKFVVYLLVGGLPGQGWNRSQPRLPGQGSREEGKTSVQGEGWQGVIENGTMTIKHEKGEIALKRVERKSPTLEQKPPTGAVVLFDGKNTDAFDGGTLLPDGSLLSGVTTKQGFGGYQLHLEFRLSWMPRALGQARSNSGVYVHDCYEIQVLDSFGLTGEDNECGGIYKVKAPDVNMCFPPLVWQTYDIDFTPPKYENGQKVANARVTVRHNGVVIHDNLELPGATPGRQSEGPAPRPIHLQAHGNRVVYRNIWLVPKD
ncbi:MAG: 3-keto-disaccharide hydrolase [Thermogutta sp.]